MPVIYFAAYLALEPGQLPARQDGTGKRARRAHAPLPLVGEADALIRTIYETVACWAEIVVTAARLTRPTTHRRRRWTTYTFTMAATDLHAKHVVEVARPVGDRPVDDTDGWSITTACATLAAHVDKLLELPPTAVTRPVQPRLVIDDTTEVEVADDGTVTRTRVTTPLLPDETLGRVLADGRAMVLVDMDGPAAGVELIDLARIAEAVVGHTDGPATRLIGVTCPNVGCEARTLVRRNGAALVTCETCGRSWPDDAYAQWTKILAADARQRLRDGTIET